MNGVLWICHIDKGSRLKLVRVWYFDAEELSDTASNHGPDSSRLMLPDRWTIVVFMEPNVRAVSLYNLFHDKTYWIPPFQRGYAWESEQVSDLFEDLEDFFEEEASNNTPYILGQVIVSEADLRAQEDGYRWSLIDGQQRTTTLTLLFAALKKRVEAIVNNPDFVNDAWRDAEHDLRNMVAFSPKPGRARVPRLSSPYADSDETIEALIVGAAPPPATSQSVERLSTAYDELLSRIESYFPDEERHRLLEFISVLMNRVFVVRLEVQSTSDALVVFERINNRGMALDVADLLKNLLFQNASEAEYVEISRLWQQTLTELHKIKQKRIASMAYLLRAIALRDGQNVAQNKVREFWQEKLEDGNISARELARQLSQEAKVLVSITKGLNHSGAKSEVVAGSHYLRFIQHVPILLQAWHLGDRTYSLVCEYLEDRVILSILSNERNSGFERYVPELMKQLGELTPDSGRADVVAAFRRAESKETIQEFVARARLGVSNLSYDKASGRNRIRYVLARITRVAQRDAGLVVPEWEILLKKQPANSNNGFHLDHIYPQSLDGGPARKHLIGNLAIITAPFNQGLGDKLPGNPQKREAYSESGMLIAKAISAESINEDAPIAVRRVLNEMREKIVQSGASIGVKIDMGQFMDEWSEESVAALGEAYWRAFENSLVITGD